MKILVRFAGDNDFSKVVLAFGDIMVMNNYRKWNQDFLTKENIAGWFNKIAPTLYLMVQNKGTYNTHPDDPTFFDGYLQITPEDVYIGPEAEKMESWESWGNGDSVLIDLDNGHPCIV